MLCRGAGRFVALRGGMMPASLAAAAMRRLMQGDGLDVNSVVDGTESLQPAVTSRSDRLGVFSATPTLLGRGRGGRGRGRGRGRGAREPQVGDWTCTCGEVNYRSRRECPKCNAPAPPLPLGMSRPKLPGEDPHDWACPCGKMNFRQSVNCFKCQMPKPVAPPEPGKEVTMWKCSRCKNIQRSTKKNCQKCLAPQEQGSTWTPQSQQQQQQLGGLGGLDPFAAAAAMGGGSAVGVPSSGAFGSSSTPGGI
jgi:hypothetical protein